MVHSHQTIWLKNIFLYHWYITWGNAHKFSDAHICVTRPQSMRYAQMHNQLYWNRDLRTLIQTCHLMNSMLIDGLDDNKSINWFIRCHVISDVNTQSKPSAGFLSFYKGRVLVQCRILCYRSQIFEHASNSVLVHEVSLPVRYDLCWARVWHNRSPLTQLFYSIDSFHRCKVLCILNIKRNVLSSMLHIPTLRYFDTSVTYPQWFRRVKFVLIPPRFVQQQYLGNIAIQPAVGCYNSWANTQCSGCSPLGEISLWNGTITYIYNRRCNRLAPPATDITTNTSPYHREQWTFSWPFTFRPVVFNVLCYMILIYWRLKKLPPFFGEISKSNLWVCFYLTIKYLIEIPRLFPEEGHVCDKLILVTYYYHRRVWLECPRHGY